MIAPVGVGEDGETYNINADLVAGKLAEILQAEKLVVLTNTPGVLDKNGKLLTGLTAQARSTSCSRTARSPAACCPRSARRWTRSKNGVKSVHIIDGRVEHALLLEVLTSDGVGTLIKRR